jgi:hypothetical protein
VDSADRPEVLMRRLVLLLILAALLVPASASALTLRDLVELSRAGLGDEVLLALIDVDRPVFSIDAETLKSLKAAGLSERVLVAVVRSGRAPAAPVAAEQFEAPQAPPFVPEPQVIVIDHHDQPQVREVAVPVPVYIPVVRRVRDHDGAPDRNRISTRDQLEGRPSATGTQKPAELQYWGWGGKRRPDAWKDK